MVTHTFNSDDSNIAYNKTKFSNHGNHYVQNLETLIHNSKSSNENSGNVIEGIKEVLNFLLFFYEKISHAQKA